MAPEDFDELDAILDELRTRYDETPQWEFCEGFMAALVCSRRPILPGEYLPVLLGIGGGEPGSEGESGGEESGSFADAAQARALHGALDAALERSRRPHSTSRLKPWMTNAATSPR